MRRPIPTVLLAAALIAAPAVAALAPGAKAPDFTTEGARAGKAFTVRLSQQLKRGPVVLYFFPAANTGGCNAEARAFADAIPKFKAAGATVIGMSADTLDTLKVFSAKECAGAFPVARAAPAVIAAYDVDYGKLVPINGGPARQITKRTSYVIAPNGTIAYEHTGNEPMPHIANTLKAVQDWRAARR
ncbi:MAG: peroxiredoxin [Pseudomonadota bacterium]